MGLDALSEWWSPLVVGLITGLCGFVFSKIRSMRKFHRVTYHVSPPGEFGQHRTGYRKCKCDPYRRYHEGVDPAYWWTVHHRPLGRRW